MGNMCCRRVGYSPNGAEVDSGRCHQQQQQEQQLQKSQPMSNAYHNAGDDCAINELLEGRMDLDVILPDGRKVRLTVERRTPMMDLLVQAASATKISPAGHTIHVFGDGGKRSSTLHYKPSTPIGSLDANTICIVSKKDSQDANGKRVSKTTNRPFEPTFRVQVHLPRNQLTVARVSPRVKISELRSMVCQEKGLDTAKYQLVRPSDPGQPLSGDLSLAEYGSTEITLLSNSCIESHICNSTSHIMPYSKRVEEQKKKTGILRLLAEDATNKKKSLTNGTSHRPAPTIKVNEPPQGRYKPKKRRPAPPPPAPVLPEPAFHSRQSSSDSSGYHEATSSYLHDHDSAATDEKASSDSSGVSSLDAKESSVHPAPSTLLNLKKRKAPAPPPKAVESGQEPQKDSDLNCEEIECGPSPQLEIIENQLISENSIDYSTETIRTDEQIENKNIQLTENRIATNEEDSKAKKVIEGEAVTRVALVALNARIDQDVTQQEIASSIQAAFQSLDTSTQKVGPSLLAIKQRSGGQRTEEGGATLSTLPDDRLDCHQPPSPPVNSNGRCSTPEDGNSCYPLQKSNAKLTLNLETKDESVDNLESFPPPPTEFRGNDNECQYIEERSPPRVTLPRPTLCSKTLRRSSSLLNLVDSAPHCNSAKTKKARHLQRSLSDLRVDDKGEFEVEQERLQREYIKLQRQFILWQQQLLSNHAMLREECIVPQYARNLRQSHSLPEGDDYSNDSQNSCPLVSRSLSYEPTKERCSTLPRSTINIPSLEFGTIPITNGSSTLRSSKTKSYFKPPQLRVSTKNRQRLPPEIRKDGDLDIYDDTKILSTILPSFDSLKLISEINDDDLETKSFRPKSNMTEFENLPYRVPSLENLRNSVHLEQVKKVPPPVPNKTSTFTKPNCQLNNERNVNGVVDNHLRCVNGGTAQPKTLCGSEKTTGQSTVINPEPPPPPPVEKSNCRAIGSNASLAPKKDVQKKFITPDVDPREQLMSEIRKFGGGTALRKISLGLAS